MFVSELNWLHKVVWLFFTTSITAALTTDLAYWILLSRRFPASVLRHPINIHEHAINYLLLLIDLFVSDIPMRLLHFAYPLLYGLIYTIFTVILWVSGVTDAVYTVLNWETNPSLAVLITMLASLVAMPLLHMLHFCLYKLRSKIASGCLCYSKHTLPLIDDKVQMDDKPIDSQTNRGFVC